MEERFVKVLEKAFPNEKTRENYKSRLNALLRNLGVERLADILEHPETWYPRIQAAYPSLTTRKNVLTAIMALFREDAVLAGHEKARALWRKRHEDLARHQEAQVKRSEPADKQIAKYTSYEEIEAEYEKQKNKAPHGTYKSSQQFLLLSFIVHMRPKRADLGAVEIFRNRNPHREDINYVVLNDRGVSFLAMNIYKTSKHHRIVEEDLPEGFVLDLRKSLTRWPRSYMFTKENGDPMSNNTYSQFVQRTFEERFGRATGVSLLRHIYISEKLAFDDMTLEEQEEEARLMLHTSGLQRRYKWPKKVLCPKLCAAEAPSPSREDKPRRQTRRRSVKRRPRDSGTRRKHRQVASLTSTEEPI